MGQRSRDQLLDADGIGPVDHPVRVRLLAGVVGAGGTMFARTNVRAVDRRPFVLEERRGRREKLGLQFRTANRELIGDLSLDINPAVIEGSIHFEEGYPGRYSASDRP